MPISSLRILINERPENEARDLEIGDEDDDVMNEPPATTQKLTAATNQTTQSLTDSPFSHLQIKREQIQVFIKIYETVTKYE